MLKISEKNKPMFNLILIKYKNGYELKELSEEND